MDTYLFIGYTVAFILITISVIAMVVAGLLAIEDKRYHTSDAVPPARVSLVLLLGALVAPALWPVLFGFVLWKLVKIGYLDA